MVMAISRRVTIAWKFLADRRAGTRSLHIEHSMQAPVTDLGLLPAGSAGVGATGFGAARWTRSG
jgi:hypothetical protein